MPRRAWGVGSNSTTTGGSIGTDGNGNITAATGNGWIPEQAGCDPVPDCPTVVRVTGPAGTIGSINTVNTAEWDRTDEPGRTLIALKLANLNPTAHPVLRLRKPGIGDMWLYTTGNTWNLALWPNR